MRTYEYTMKGTAADGQTWETEGAIDDADFSFVPLRALADSFHKLTNGEAVFGHPGIGLSRAVQRH